MFKKIVITLLIILAVISGVIFALMMQNNKGEEEQSIALSEKVTDECTEEYEQSLNETSEEASSSDKKISPNCLMALKKDYIDCGHTINEYIELPQELVNMTEDDLQKEYPDWTIEQFSENEIILYKKMAGNCGEHYILRAVDEKIVIYKLEDDGTETEHLRTEISTEYLTETDKINMECGLEVHGAENLNMLLEDFE